MITSSADWWERALLDDRKRLRRPVPRKPPDLRAFAVAAIAAGALRLRAIGR